ncbi:MAG: DUF1338 domain-containing protein [Bacteroidales bacterium]|nr:DUF1338 domain-containing protein [Bacteroidales bacterium]
MEQLAKAQKIFDRLWEDYTSRNPAVKKVYDLFVSQGENVVNDHIAFRTFNDPRVNIDVFSKPFVEAGYEYKGEYEFKTKHLYARHFEFKAFRSAPRVFISQLILEDFSPFLQHTIRQIIDRIPEFTLKPENLIFAENAWGTPSYEIYQKLRSESEYAAWVYVHGYRANHFTVSINDLQKFNSIYQVNGFLKDNGFHLNDSDGEVKGTPEELLEQSSIKSGIIDVEFKEGTYPVPSCYYEFARRYPDKEGNLYLGFIAKSADKIFESTDFYEKKPTDK